MEDEVNLNSLQAQPLPQTPSPVSTPANWVKNILFILLAVIIIAGLLFAGIQIGKKQITSQQPITKQSTITPIVVAVNSTIIPTTILPTEPKPTTNSTSDWKIYIDPNGLYSFKYPVNYSLGRYATDNSPLLINNRIDWGVAQHPVSSCMGDCPIVTITQNTAINNYAVVLYEGWVGSIGGETPQSYTKYEIKQPSTGNYFVITLWELDRTSEAQKNYAQDRKVGAINESDKKIFNQIVSTFRFI